MQRDVEDKEDRERQLERVGEDREMQRESE
jgi:hypothetical protein